MDSIYNILHYPLFDIVTIGSPAVLLLGYMVYSCCSSNKTVDHESAGEELNHNTEAESEPMDYDDINDKNSKLAFMLMMLLSVEPKLNEKYIHFARNIGYDHIVEDIEQETKAD
jgi:hypothetical protein